MSAIPRGAGEFVPQVASKSATSIARISRSYGTPKSRSSVKPWQPGCGQSETAGYGAHLCLLAWKHIEERRLRNERASSRSDGRVRWGFGRCAGILGGLAGGKPPENG